MKYFFLSCFHFVCFSYISQLFFFRFLVCWGTFLLLYIFLILFFSQIVVFSRLSPAALEIRLMMMLEFIIQLEEIVRSAHDRVSSSRLRKLAEKKLSEREEMLERFRLCFGTHQTLALPLSFAAVPRATHFSTLSFFSLASIRRSSQVRAPAGLVAMMVSLVRIAHTKGKLAEKKKKREMKIVESNGTINGDDIAKHCCMSIGLICDTRKISFFGEKLAAVINLLRELFRYFTTKI